MKPDSSGKPRRRASPRMTPPERMAVDAPTMDGTALPALPSQRGTLTRQKVLTAAIEVIDTDGARDFTMRRVAQRLGVETMALYRYFPSRENLLDGVVERVVDDLYNDPTVDLNSDNWPDFLSHIAHGVRRTALAHPLLFPLIATRGSAAPWVWPPLRSLRWMEGFLETFHRCGFNGPASLRIYREFSSFLLGHLMLETFPHHPHPPPPEPLPDRSVSPSLAGRPRLDGVQSELRIDHSTEEFHRSLHRLIDRVDQLEHRSNTSTG